MFCCQNEMVEDDEVFSSGDETTDDAEDNDDDDADIENNNDHKTGDFSGDDACCQLEKNDESACMPADEENSDEVESQNMTLVAGETSCTGGSPESSSDESCEETVDTNVNADADAPLNAPVDSYDDFVSNIPLPSPLSFNSNTVNDDHVDEISSPASVDELDCSADCVTSVASLPCVDHVVQSDDGLSLVNEEGAARKKRRSRVSPVVDDHQQKNPVEIDQISSDSNDTEEPVETSGKCATTGEEQSNSNAVEVSAVFHYFTSQCLMIFNTAYLIVHEKSRLCIVTV
jgi:hypothetical protein